MALRTVWRSGESWDADEPEQLVDLLLSPMNARSRCRIVRDGPLYITKPPDRTERGGAGDLPREMVMTLEHELRWIPGLVHGYPEQYPDPHHVVVMGGEHLLRMQTTNIDDTRWWDWANLRQSRIKHSERARAVDIVPRPARSADLAFRRVMFSLANLAAGEAHSLELRLSGFALTSGQRTQLQRATGKIASVCRRFAFLVHVNSEGGKRTLKRKRRALHRHDCFGHPAFLDPDEPREVDLVVLRIEAAEDEPISIAVNF